LSGESHARSIAKAVSWRLTGSLDTFFVALVISGRPELVGGLAPAEMPAKVAP
jgi:Predicted membrane protein (DUF2061)